MPERIMPVIHDGFPAGYDCFFHSADLSYRLAYLRAHYPAPFLCARLANYGGFHHPAIYIAEAQRLGMAVKPPHVNLSQRHFTLTYDEHQPILWMGLGQVRDLRRQTTKKMIAARKNAPFASLSHLRRRVPIQPKELTHLIQCGALDGLGANRASLLAEGKGQQAQVGQLGFAFLEGVKMPAESLQQRLQWEEHLLGFPVSAHPIQTKQAEWTDVTPISQLATQLGNMVTIAGSKLPGWTGGKGFYFGDGTGYVSVLGIDEKQLRAWQPVCLQGRLVRGRWGSERFEVKRFKLL